MRGTSLLICMAGIRSRANGWFTLKSNLPLKGRPPPIIFVRIDRPLNALQLCNFVLLTVFTQRNFVANFIQAKCSFTLKKKPFCVCEPSLGGLGATFE